MISKDLLSEVIGKRIHSRGMRYADDYVNFITVFGEDEDKAMHTCNSSWNIYELAHKCKEWANRCGIKGKNYQLVSSLFPESLGGGYCEVWSGAYKQVEEDFVGNTEPEAIFMACQWILNNKETK